MSVASWQTEEDHASQRERELQAKRQLEEALKAKDAEHKREIERINVENAFKVAITALAVLFTNFVLTCRH